MLRLFKFLAPYKLRVVASVASSSPSPLPTCLPPYIGGRIVDTLTTTGRNPSLGMTRLIMLVAVLAVAR